jgi:hypothetical protein
LRASGAKGTSLIDREYDAATIPNVPAALQSAGSWLQFNKGATSGNISTD